MPTYDYECNECGHKFEEFQSITAAPLRTCPKCHKRKARRLIGAGAGIIFKGSGFYQTDYRSDSYKKAAEKDKPAVATAPASSSSGATGGAGASKDAPAKKSPDSASSSAGSSGAKAKKKD